MKKLLLLAFAMCLFAACSKDDDTTLPVETFDVISFEPAEKMLDLITGKPLVLKDVTMSLYDFGNYTFSSVFCGKDYVPAAPENFDAPLFSTKDGGIRFGSYYANGFDAWAGFTLSTTADRTGKEANSKSQFSAWASSGSGGSKTFAVCYDMNSGMMNDPSLAPFMADYGWPTIEFTAQPRVVSHLWIANSTWTAMDYKGESSDRYAVKIYGELRNRRVGEIEVLLISGAAKLEGWQRVNLLAFGEVDKLIFCAVPDNMMRPTYFCIDEIALKQIAK